MFDRKFEAFLLEHVCRESVVFFGIMITLACCGIACIVMSMAALIIFGTAAIGTSIKLFIVALAFASGCYAGRFLGHRHGGVHYAEHEVVK